jgi:hypothetical protein
VALKKKKLKSILLLSDSSVIKRNIDVHLREGLRPNSPDQDSKRNRGRDTESKEKLWMGILPETSIFRKCENNSTCKASHNSLWFT